jgi:hypothetical protein
MIKIFVLLVVITLNLHAQYVPERNAKNVNRVLLAASDFALAKDKQLHMGTCYVISSLTSALVYKKTKNKMKASICGFSIAMLAGTVKEMCDINHGDSDMNDILANSIGSSLGVITIRITL